MAKDGNTYAKRQRETLKRQKQGDKRDRRQKRKDQAGNPAIASENATGDAVESASLASERPGIEP